MAFDAEALRRIDELAAENAALRHEIERLTMAPFDVVVRVRETVCTTHSVNWVEISGAAKNKGVCAAHYEAAVHLHEQRGFSLMQIGRIRRRDYSSVQKLLCRHAESGAARIEAE